MSSNSSSPWKSQGGARTQDGLLGSDFPALQVQPTNTPTKDSTNSPGDHSSSPSQSLPPKSLFQESKYSDPNTSVGTYPFQNTPENAENGTEEQEDNQPNYEEESEYTNSIATHTLNKHKTTDFSYEHPDPRFNLSNPMAYKCYKKLYDKEEANYLNAMQEAKGNITVWAYLWSFADGNGRIRRGGESFYFNIGDIIFNSATEKERNNNKKHLSKEQQAKLLTQGMWKGRVVSFNIQDDAGRLRRATRVRVQNKLPNNLPSFKYPPNLEGVVYITNRQVGRIRYKGVAKANIAYAPILNNAPGQTPIVGSAVSFTTEFAYNRLVATDLVVIPHWDPTPTNQHPRDTAAKAANPGWAKQNTEVVQRTIHSEEILEIYQDLRITFDLGTPDGGCLIGKNHLILSQSRAQKQVLACNTKNTTNANNNLDIEHNLDVQAENAWNRMEKKLQEMESISLDSEHEYHDDAYRTVTEMEQLNAALHRLKPHNQFINGMITPLPGMKAAISTCEKVQSAFNNDHAKQFAKVFVMIPRDPQAVMHTISQTEQSPVYNPNQFPNMTGIHFVTEPVTTEEITMGGETKLEHNNHIVFAVFTHGANRDRHNYDMDMINNTGEFRDAVVDPVKFALHPTRGLQDVEDPEMKRALLVTVPRTDQYNTLLHTINQKHNFQILRNTHNSPTGTDTHMLTCPSADAAAAIKATLMNAGKANVLSNDVHSHYMDSTNTFNITTKPDTQLPMQHLIDTLQLTGIQWIKNGVYRCTAKESQSEPTKIRTNIQNFHSQYPGIIYFFVHQGAQYTCQKFSDRLQQELRLHGYVTHFLSLQGFPRHTNNNLISDFTKKILKQHLDPQTPINWSIVYNHVDKECLVEIHNTKVFGKLKNTQVITAEGVVLRWREFQGLKGEIIQSADTSTKETGTQAQEEENEGSDLEEIVNLTKLTISTQPAQPDSQGKTKETNKKDQDGWQTKRKKRKPGKPNNASQSKTSNPTHEPQARPPNRFETFTDNDGNVDMEDSQTAEHKTPPPNPSRPAPGKRKGREQTQTQGSPPHKQSTDARMRRQLTPFERAALPSNKAGARHHGNTQNPIPTNTSNLIILESQ